MYIWDLVTAFILFSFLIQIYDWVDSSKIVLVYLFYGIYVCYGTETFSSSLDIYYSYEKHALDLKFWRKCGLELSVNICFLKWF